jgi:hypothetical protein
MADYRRAETYRVFHFVTGQKAKTTDVIVTVEDGGVYRYEGLSPERAHLIIDLLRNEDTIWIELESGLLQVAQEPVGEGE